MSQNSIFIASSLTKNLFPLFSLFMCLSLFFFYQEIDAKSSYFISFTNPFSP
ncbi:hypothetical protein BSM4216_2594 [Bacillus smithii]|nr:hypothetical protein BSM4216_2594 [Bacillus smithii]